jgi:hypothetical protein
MSSDLPGVNPATLKGMILYYRLMSKWSGLGDSTELSWVGLSQSPAATTSSGQQCRITVGEEKERGWQQQHPQGGGLSSWEGERKSHGMGPLPRG